jgi:hypothetical protein
VPVKLLLYDQIPFLKKQKDVSVLEGGTPGDVQEIF